MGLNGLYCLAELLEFAAFLKLWWSHPDLRRPYKVPFGLEGCVLLLAAPSLLCLLLLMLPLFPSMGHRPDGAMFTLGSALAGVLLHAILSACRRLRLCNFLHPRMQASAEAFDVLDADPLLL